MPKLNTTIDNLELKSNKIISTSQVSPDNWTDSQYPSAKTLLNIAHPIGSVLTTATNANPAATLGGVWELIDKTLKPAAIAIASSAWAGTKATLGTYGAFASVADHTVAVRLHLRTTADITDTTASIELGTLDMTACGVNRLEFADLCITTTDDSQNRYFTYNFHTDGLITISDVTGGGTLAAGAEFYATIVQPVDSARMIDSFCDKFYWKRTA